MVTPREIKKKALAKYRAFCKAYLNSEDFFPLEIPCNKGKLTDPFIERKNSIESLLRYSVEKKGFGYTIDWESVNSRKYGVQSRIKRIYFTDARSFLRYIDKAGAFKNFSINVSLIRESLPQLEEWLDKNISHLETDPQIWPKLLAVCAWFMENPAPNIYLREIPLEIHSKFIEENRKVLRSLLDFLLPAERVETTENDFSKRYQLKYDEPLIRCRYLVQGTETDVSKPLGIFINEEISVEKVFIIENKTNFLSFPLFDNSVVMWGSGFQAGVLKEIHWLAHKKLFYWGDIDPPGFEILSLVRSFFPRTRSLLMDSACYRTFQQFAVPLPLSPPQEPPFFLTAEEAELYQTLVQHPEQGRLEQEHVSQEYLLNTLAKKQIL